MDSPITHFLIGGTIVSVVNHFSKSDKPEIAAILTTFPIGLLAMYFIKESKKLNNLGKRLIWTNMAIIFTYVCMVFLLERNIPILNDYIILISFAIWVLLAVIFYKISLLMIK